MTTGRLTNYLREQICRKLITEQFSKKLEGLEGLFSVLAEQCYNAAFQDSMRVQMYDLPAGWLPTDDTIKVHLGGTHTHLHFNGQLPHNLRTYNHTYLRSTRDEETYRFPDNKHHTICLSLNGTHPLSTSYMDLEAASKELMSEAGGTQKETLGVLGSFHTTKTLVEAWPEIEEVVKTVVPIVKSNVPAPLIAKLNLRLGLAF